MSSVCLFFCSNNRHTNDVGRPSRDSQAHPESPLREVGIIRRRTTCQRDADAPLGCCALHAGPGSQGETSLSRQTFRNSALSRIDFFTDIEADDVVDPWCGWHSRFPVTGLGRLISR